MSKTMGIIVNRKKEGAVQYVRGMIQWLEEKENQILVTNWLGKRIHRHDLVADKSEMGEKSDLVVSLGGDGTLCRAARDFAPYEVPLLGINFGGLGFLTEIPISRYQQGLKKILADDYRTEKRLMLEANLIRNKEKIETCLALNDVVISKRGIPRIINLKTFVGGEFITTYSADGLVISTPTGSTAYSLSTGGPVVHPNLGVVILSPICAHTLAVRPLVIPETDEIDVLVEPSSGKTLLTIDGQVVYDLKEEDIIRVKKAPSQATLIRLKEKFFFRMLQTKLGWTGISYKAPR